VLGNSLIFDNGTNVGIGNQGTTYKLEVSGTGYFSGIVGIGVAPSAWYNINGYVALQIGNASLFGRNSANSELYLSSNAYDNNTTGDATYITTDFAARYIQNDGTHTWLTAPSGTAGTAVTFTPRMTILQGGNVGIGTSSPSYKFHVSNNTNGFISRFTGGTSSDVNIGIFGSTAGAFGSIGTESNHPFNIFTNGTDRLTITSDGNVGIGNSSPGTVRLYVQSIVNNWTGNFVGNSTSGQSLGLLVTAGTTSADSSFFVQNQTGTLLYFKIRGDGWLISPSTYNNTSGVAANVGIDSAGNIFRATSSIKYKTDIKPYDKGLDKVLLMNPIYYKSISDFDGDKQFAGFIAEEIHELGLNEFVQYNDENNKPEGLNYGNITALLVKAIQEQQALITSLQSQINELKNK
jgi:hypothetical protein